MIRLVDVVARVLPISRLKAIASDMELLDDEEYLLIERCAKMKTIDQCDHISASRQYDIMKRLDTKMTTWIFKELDAGKNSFLTRHEQDILRKNLHYDLSLK